MRPSPRPWPTASRSRPNAASTSSPTANSPSPASSPTSRNVSKASRAAPGQKLILFQQEVAAFPEYYAEYFKQAMLGGALVPITPVVCVGPVKYRGEKLLQIDIDNMKAAAKAAGVPDHHVFLPATAPSGVGINEYYKSDEEYFHAARRRDEQGISRRSSTPAFCSRSTIRSCPTCSSSRASTTRRRSGARKSMSRRPTPRSRASRPRRCASTPATASIDGPRLFEAALVRCDRLHAEGQCRLLQLRGRQSAPRARISSVRDREGA